MNADRVQFIDTNVLVYAHDVSAGPKHEIAARLIDDLWRLRSGCLSTQILQEFYVTLTRRVQRPLSGADAFSLVAFYSAWQAHSPGIGDVLAAIEAHQRFNISYWDALMLRSAEQLGCDIVWSEDLNSGQKYGSVTVINPFLPSAIR